MIQRQHKSVRSRVHGPEIAPQGVRFLTYLLAAAALVFWLAGPAHSHDLESLRSLQQKELDAIEAKDAQGLSESMRALVSACREAEDDGE